MNCPWCGQPMERGQLRSRGENYYLPNGCSAPLLYSQKAITDKGGVKLPPDYFHIPPNWPETYHCRACRKLVLPYEP